MQRRRIAGSARAALLDGGERIDPDPEHYTPEIRAHWPLVAASAIVLTRGVHDETQHFFKPPSCEELEALHHELQADLVRSLPGSVQSFVADRGHFLPRDAPEEAVAAIRAMVTSVRTDQSAAAWQTLCSSIPWLLLRGR